MVVRLIISLIFLFMLVAPINIVAGLPPKETSREIIQDIAKRNQLDQRILVALAKLESGLNPKAVDINRKHFGLFQLNAQTALSHCGIKKIKDLLNPKINTDCAVKYFKSFYDQHQSYARAIAEFNAGGLIYNIRTGRPINESYVTKVLALSM